MTSRSGSISRCALAAGLAALACLAGPVASAAAEPQTRIVSGPAGPTNDRTPEFGFEGPDGADLRCKLPPVQPTFSTCSSPFRTAEAEYPIPLEDGDYMFEVGVGGDADPEPSRRQFTIDTVAPEIELTGGPGDTTAATAVFTFSAPGAANFSCRLDGGAWEPCGSPHEYRTLSLGPHRFEVTAVDAAGNEDPTPAEHAWQVLRPGLVIPSAVAQAIALARELVQMRRALARIRLRTLARRKTIVFRTFDALTAGTVEIRVRARIRQGGRRRRVATLTGEREVPAAGRHGVRVKVTKKGRRLARRRKKLPVELRLSFTDLAGRSLWAASKLTLKR